MDEVSPETNKGADNVNNALMNNSMNFIGSIRVLEGF